MKPLPVFSIRPCMIPDMSSCKLFWNQKAPDDTRWVTLLDLCCRCKWLTSTLLFLQGLHLRKYTTSRLDISFCLISFLCAPQDSSKSRLCILLEFCAVKSCATAVAQPLSLLQPLISLAVLPRRILPDHLQLCLLDRGAYQSKGQGPRLRTSRRSYTSFSNGYLFHLGLPCCHHRRRHRSHQSRPLAPALVSARPHQMT